MVDPEEADFSLIEDGPPNDDNSDLSSKTDSEKTPILLQVTQPSKTGLFFLNFISVCSAIRVKTWLYYFMEMFTGSSENVLCLFF